MPEGGARLANVIAAKTMDPTPQRQILIKVIKRPTDDRVVPDQANRTAASGSRRRWPSLPRELCWHVRRFGLRTAMMWSVGGGYCGTHATIPTPQLVDCRPRTNWAQGERQEATCQRSSTKHWRRLEPNGHPSMTPPQPLSAQRPRCCLDTNASTSHSCRATIFGWSTIYSVDTGRSTAHRDTVDGDRSGS